MRPDAGMGEAGVARVHPRLRVDVGLHERDRIVARGVRHRPVLGRVRPEAAAHDGERLGVPSVEERAEEPLERVAPREAVRLALQRPHVLAERDDEHVGILLGELLGLRPVPAAEVALEVGVVAHHEVCPAAEAPLDLARDEVDEVLIRRARGHAPVVGPADRRVRSVQRDGVADEQHLHSAGGLPVRGVSRRVHLRRVVALGVGHLAERSRRQQRGGRRLDISIHYARSIPNTSPDSQRALPLEVFQCPATSSAAASEYGLSLIH